MQELPDVLSLSSTIQSETSAATRDMLPDNVPKGTAFTLTEKAAGFEVSQRDGLSKMGRDGAGSMIICHNCGGRGHMAYECPSARLASCGVRRY
ncbi:hypothetical protein HID58_047485 [Brassica napus]|uniref:CCHC-type domain-containing protein n=1 Tax=Brassica napus TaxID=3708 RepID=A0ABQ8AZG8_BRANA|nr:hypothetical protein HID58_047485 [Brassica napus]